MIDNRRVISVIVINEASVLARIAGLFAARGYNIESLTVAPVPESKYSRITIATSGDSRMMEQIVKQLHKLIPVLKVIEHDEQVEKEMALVKFPITQSLADIEALCHAYNGKIVNVGTEVIIAMVADEPKRVGYFLSAVKNFNPVEIVRSGVVAVER